MLTSKICRRCKQDLPIEQFYKSRNNPDGLDFQCKDCNKAGQKAWRGTKKQEAQPPDQTDWMKWVVKQLKTIAEADGIQLDPEPGFKPAPVAEPVVESVAVVPLAPPEVSVVRKALDPETGVPYAETDDHHNDNYIAERYGR